jgi:hypothetical protein
MKSSTARLKRSSKSGRFALTRAQGEKISAVEGMKLTGRMKRILDLPVTDDERRSLIKAQVRGK